MAAQGLAGNMVNCTPRVLFYIFMNSRAPLQKNILNNVKRLMA